MFKDGKFYWFAGLNTNKRHNRIGNVVLSKSTLNIGAYSNFLGKSFDINQFLYTMSTSGIESLICLYIWILPKSWVRYIFV